MGTYLFYAGVALTGIACLMYLAESTTWQLIWVQIQNAISNSDQEMYLKVVPADTKPGIKLPILALGLLLLIANKFTD